MRILRRSLIAGLAMIGVFCCLKAVFAADYYAEYWDTDPVATPSMPTGSPTATTTVAAVDFDWGDGSPDGIGADGFIARYTKTVSSGRYDMTLGSDDGTRVYFDGVKVLDMWVDQGYKEMTGSYTVASSGSHTLIVEYYENAGGAVVYFNYDLMVTSRYLAGANGTISGSSTQYLKNGATSTAVTAVPDNGYRFVDWSDGSTANPRTDSALTENSSVTANFALSPFEIVYQAGTGGSVAGSSTQRVLIGSSTEAVSAEADTGYSFLRWDDGATSTSRFESNVSGNATYTAEFLLDTFTLSYSAAAGGSLSGSSTQVVGYGLDGSEVSAAAASGYHFSGWSDGIDAVSRIDKDTKASLSVMANFEKNKVSAPVTLPGAIGGGSREVSISMNGTNDIKLVTPSGANVLAYINSQADFQAPESSQNWRPASHSLLLAGLDLAENKVTIIISSNKSQAISMKKGETRDVDLDGDGWNDIRLVFANIYINRAEITVSSLSESSFGVNILQPAPVIDASHGSQASEQKAESKPSASKSTVIYVFKRDLKFGMRNAEVRELQNFLNQRGYLIAVSGPGSKGNETDYFGKGTRLALEHFQKDRGIIPAAGYFGPLTRKVVNGR